jgi:hypothetical protein
MGQMILVKQHQLVEVFNDQLLVVIDKYFGSEMNCYSSETGHVVSNPSPASLTITLTPSYRGVD